MGKFLQTLLFVVIFSRVSAKAAKADTLTYDLTGPYGIDITFNLPQDPSFTSTSFGYIVPVTGLTVGPFSINNLDFFSSSHGGGFGYSFYGSLYQLTGSQLYTYNSGSLVLSTGNFTLETYGTPLSLTVSDGETLPVQPPNLPLCCCWVQPSRGWDS